MAQPSIAERVAERVGYAIGALIFGPSAALEIRARRIARQALLGFCEPLEPVKLVAPKGTLARAGRLTTTAGAIPIEIHLDVRDRRAAITAAIQALPSYVQATVSRDAATLHGVKLRLGPALAVLGTLRLVSETLDADSANAMLASIAAGPLAGFKAYEIELRSERMESFIVAPSSVEEWDAVGHGIVGLRDWLAAKWPESYR